MHSHRRTGSNNSNTSGTIKEHSNDTVMILCGPNACSYEVFAYTDKWIDCYLDYGINVVLWNYRGYGGSNGRVNFNNIKTDAKFLEGYLKEKFKFTKIGVHGVSIGGFPACYLASENLVNFCFADRTFSSIEEFTEIPFYFSLRYIYKILLMQSSDNVNNFLKVCMTTIIK
jgi:pimeloyl-ACP methyl ester carboxylesterase